MARHHPFLAGLLATVLSVGVGLTAFLLLHNWLVTVTAGILASTLVRGVFDVANPEANLAGVLAGVGAGLGSVATGVPAYFAWGLGAGIGVGLGIGAAATLIGAAVGLLFWPASRKGIKLGSRSQGGRHAPQT